MNIAKQKYVGLVLMVVAALVFAQCGGGTQPKPKGSTGGTGDGITSPKGSTKPLALAPFQGQIKFKHASSNLRSDKGLFSILEPVLNRAAPAIKKLTDGLPKGEKLYVIGHADSIGGKRAAINFGYARALAVINYLASKGVSRAKMAPFSAADNDMQNRNDIKADENHRVTFAVK